jgi:hypothetical protein
VLAAVAGLPIVSLATGRISPIRAPSQHVTRERPASDPVVSGAFENQSNPAAAWGTDSYLVAWEDDRNDDGSDDVFAARVAADGTVLDPAGIAIATGPGQQRLPDVASDGTDFLVVWGEEVGVGQYDVFGARVSPEGVILDQRIEISTATGYQQDPSVAWSGVTYLVVWDDSRGGDNDIFGARVTADGTVLDVSGVRLWNTRPPDKGAFNPRIDWGDTTYLVTWEVVRTDQDTDILAERVDADGIVLDTGALQIAVAEDFQFDPDVAWGGGLFLVAYDDQAHLDDSVRGRRVTSDGTVLDDPSIAVGNGGEPRIGWDGQNFLVAWTGIEAARVTAQGMVLDLSGIEITDITEGVESLTAVGNGSDSLVLWGTALYSSTSDMLGARVDRDGILLDPDGFLVATQPANATTAPAVAWDGQDYLVAWEDLRDGDPAIYAGRITSHGTPLDGGGIAVATGGDDEDPAVAWDGRNYLVVWSHWDPDAGADVWGARVTPGGRVLDRTAIRVASASLDQFSPSVAFDGTNYLVAWVDERADERGRDIYATRVSPQGEVLDAAFPISKNDLWQIDPTVTTDGTQWFVAWQDQQAGDWDIDAARVSSDGQVLDRYGILVTTDFRDQISPTASWDGTDFVVAWSDLRTGVDRDIYAARVTVDGLVLDPEGIPISTAVDDQTTPSASWDGVNTLIAWSDRRSGQSSNLTAARLSPDGTVLDPTGRAISLLAGDELFPAVAGTTSGRAFVAYQRFASETPYDGLDRVFFRFYSE